MSKPLLGRKIAILVANGFNQQDFTEIQRQLNTAGASLKVISPDQGLVNGWEGTAWGHHFPVDQQLGVSLGVDFDILVVPGGSRSMDKLKTTAHTRRFVSSFVAAGKPMALFSEGVELLAFAAQAAGRTVGGPETSRAVMEQSGATWSEGQTVADNNLITGVVVTDSDRTAFIGEMINLFVAREQDIKQAA